MQFSSTNPFKSSSSPLPHTSGTGVSGAGLQALLPLAPLDAPVPGAPPLGIPPVDGGMNVTPCPPAPASPLVPPSPPCNTPPALDAPNPAAPPPGPSSGGGVMSALAEHAR